MALADARTSLGELQELIAAKDEEIEQLTVRIKTKGDLVREGEAYYAKDDTGAPKGDPFCANCLERDGIAVHLASNPDNRIRCFCPSCKTQYWRAACREL